MVSIIFGTSVFSYFWISFNALLMQFTNIQGHLIIIFVGIPLLFQLVKTLRERKMNWLIRTNIKDLKIESDCLQKIHLINDLGKGICDYESHQIDFIGMIEVHYLECVKDSCPCNEELELYDSFMKIYSNRT